MSSTIITFSERSALIFWLRHVWDGYLQPHLVAKNPKLKLTYAKGRSCIQCWLQILDSTIFVQAHVFPVLREVIWHRCRLPWSVTHDFLCLVYTISHILPVTERPRNSLPRIATPIHTPPRVSAWFPLASGATPQSEEPILALCEKHRRTQYLQLAQQ